MPGLVGIISDNNHCGQLLERMTRSIMHEPWYKVDTYVNAPFNIAGVHLGVFNPGPQPIFNEDRTLCVFMEGKVYGYDDEKKRLEATHRFATGSDAEFCLHLYEEQGPRFAERLNGQFVVVICDLVKKKVVLANDRQHLMPLYYAVRDNCLLFAPEAKAILQDETLKGELDIRALVSYFAFGDFWGDRTLFEGVKLLPPASILTYCRGELSVNEYWHFTPRPDDGYQDEQIVEDLAGAFRRAVALRLRDPLRYAISLSGGLDCRTVLASVEPAKRKEIATYSYGPPYCDQISIASRVARMCGTRHRFIELPPELLVQNAEQLVWLTDGRNYFEGSFFHPIHRQIRDDVDVMLDGFVLDRTLGGSHLNRKLINPADKEEIISTVAGGMRLFGERDLLRLFRPEYHDLAREAPPDLVRREFDKVTGADPRSIYDEFFMRTSVAYASSWHVPIRDLLEVSFPAVDNDLLDVMFRIPPEKRLRHRIHRKLLMSLSPELAGITYNRTNLPASVPLPLWMGGRAYHIGKEKLKEKAWRATGGRLYIRNGSDYVDQDGYLRANESWKTYFRSLLLESGSLSREYLNQDYISYLFTEHEKGTMNAAYGLMRLVAFELFLRLFMAPPSPAPVDWAHRGEQRVSSTATQA